MYPFKFVGFLKLSYVFMQNSTFSEKVGTFLGVYTDLAQSFLSSKSDFP